MIEYVLMDRGTGSLISGTLHLMHAATRRPSSCTCQVEHFLPFKQLFTVAEAASLIGSYQEGGKLDKVRE